MDELGDLQEVVQAQGAELKQLRKEVDRMQEQAEKTLLLVNRLVAAMGNVNAMVTSHREILEKIVKG